MNYVLYIGNVAPFIYMWQSHEMNLSGNASLFTCLGNIGNIELMFLIGKLIIGKVSCLKKINTILA